MDNMTDKNEYRLCPFRRSLIRTHKRATQDSTEENYTDHFGRCCGRNCMAYRDGHCLRLENPEKL